MNRSTANFHLTLNIILFIHTHWSVFGHVYCFMTSDKNQDPFIGSEALLFPESDKRILYVN